MANIASPGMMSHRSLNASPVVRCIMPSNEMFWAIESRFSPFFSVRQTIHSWYCPMMYSGLLISMGSAKSTVPHTTNATTKRILCFEKKKNASPTIPYNFTNVPTTMKNAASVSRSFSMRKNANTIMAAIATLNCCINKAVSSSWAQNHKMNNCWRFVRSDRLMAT